MKPKTLKIIGWVLSGLLAAFLLFGSAVGKFTDWEGKEEMFSTLGWSLEAMVTVGILEVAFTILFLVPRIGFYGAILLTAYLGGAAATHMRVGEPIIFPIIIGVFVWVALALREGSVLSAAKLGAKSGA